MSAVRRLNCTFHLFALFLLPVVVPSCSQLLQRLALQTELTLHHLSDLEKASAQFNNMQMTDIGQTLSELSRRNEENERQITAQEKLITQLKETQVSGQGERNAHAAA